jgi:large subunit ribosomal protein L21
MYAIIKSGGKQFRVKKDDIIEVELLHKEDGSDVEFEVLYFHDGNKAIVQRQSLESFRVRGELLGISPGPKINSLKYIPGNHCKRFGHRQKYSRVKITHFEEKKGAAHGA